MAARGEVLRAAEAKSSRTGQRAAVAGGLFGALAASSCCILPLLLVSAGAGGAWIGNLTALAPYQPLIAVITLILIGSGFWLVYRTPRPACAEGGACPGAAPQRLVKAGLWTATVILAAALAFPYAAPVLLGT